MSEEIVKAKKKDVWRVKFSQLALHDKNPREDIVELSEMVMSIKAHGVIEALFGYFKNGTYYVKNGSRRYYAMEVIWNSEGVDTECWFLIEPRGTTEAEGLLRQLIANSGKDLTPIEKAFAINRFINEFGWSIKQVAESLQFSEVYVKRLLSLTTAPPEFIALVKKHDISATFAMEKIAEGKAKVEDFLSTHKDGGFAKYQDQEIFEEPENREKKEQKQAKITKKDLEGKGIPNSWNEFKKYADKADYLEMWEGALYSPVQVFQFMLRLKNNEVVWEDVRDFFMSKSPVKEKKVKDDIQDDVKIFIQKGSVMQNGETVVREYPK